MNLESAQSIYPFLSIYDGTEWKIISGAGGVHFDHIQEGPVSHEPDGSCWNFRTICF